MEIINGSKGLEPCSCGLFDNTGQPNHNNIFQASLERAQEGRKPNQKNTCLQCGATWKDYKDNYTTICKCGSQKIIGEAYHPEQQLHKVMEAPYKLELSMPRTYGHENIYNNRIAQASTTETPTSAPPRKKRTLEELNKVMSFTGGR